MTRLNVGCGRRVLPGWINIDAMPLAGVDIVADLEACGDCPLPLDADSADELLLSHVIEHIQRPLPLMQDLHRIAKAGARMTIRVPFGASDDAFEDPTHVRPYFLNSFGYFSQPFYWRADYGYRGDWQIDRLVLRIPQAPNLGLSIDDILGKVMRERNVVAEMVAELRAIKPIRAPRQDLQSRPEIVIDLV
jgi:hypothetical protein